MANMNERKPPSQRMVERGKRLAEYRESLGMTQESFAELIGKSTVQVGRYERGLSQIPDDIKETLYREHKMDVTYLVTGDKYSNLLEIEADLPHISTDVLYAYFKSIFRELDSRDDGKMKIKD